MRIEKRTIQISGALKVILLIAVMGWTGIALSKPPKAEFKKGGNARSIAWVENKEYTEECGSCHIGYLPGFLPKRSWIKLIKNLENHFGENAALDEEPRKSILSYLISNSADHSSSTRRSKKIAWLIQPKEVPIRITETTFWKRRHSSIRAWVWKRDKVKSKAQCDTCHSQADKGIYDENTVEIPQ